MTTSRPLQRSISAVPCEPGGLRGTGLERVRVPETTGVLPRRRTEACRRTMPRFSFCASWSGEPPSRYAFAGNGAACAGPDWNGRPHPGRSLNAGESGRDHRAFRDRLALDGACQPPVLVPVLLAWVIATIFHPVVRFLQEHKVSRALTAVLITAGLAALMVGVLLLLATPVTYVVGRAADLGALLMEKFQLLSQPLALMDEMRRTLSSITSSEPAALKVEQPPANVVQRRSRC